MISKIGDVALDTDPSAAQTVIYRVYTQFTALSTAIGELVLNKFRRKFLDELMVKLASELRLLTVGTVMAV